MSVKEIDYMETTCDTDAHAQAAYVTNLAPSAIVSQTDSGPVGTIGDAGGGEYRGGAVFDLGGSNPIGGVSFKLGANSGSPTGNWTIRIETTSGGLPTGTLAHASATKVFTPVASAWNDVIFDNCFTLAAGTYALIQSCDNQATDVAWDWSYLAVGSGGKYIYTVNAGSWIAYALGNRAYKIYNVQLQSYSEATIKTQGSYALKAVAAQTDSLNKTLTKTFSPALDLSGLDAIKFDIYASRTGANIKISIHDSGGTTSDKTYTVLAANTWETVTWDTSAISNADKDAIDSIKITIVDATNGNVFFLDNMYATVLSSIKTINGLDRANVKLINGLAIASVKTWNGLS